MGLFDKLKEPIFLRESNSAQLQIEKLRKLEPMLNEDGKAKLNHEIKMLEYGIAGEKNIAFELKNSHMPMYVLHDINLESDGLAAQIDYMVFTKKLCFVIECKNLFGDIEINNAGDFIRTVEFGSKKKKEGIYSPVTQNRRHLELMRKIKMESKGGFLRKMIVGNSFDDFNKSVVVLSNPRTVLNAKYAKKDVRDQVIRADQLVKYIKDTYKSCKEMESPESALLAWAQSYLELHVEREYDYSEKFIRYMKDADSVESDAEVEVEADTYCESADESMQEAPDVTETPIFKELKAYRLGRSREENIKPYFIYNDNQLKDLISKMPLTPESLKTVSGFGDAKCAKYGEDIIGIVKKYL